MTDLRKLLMTIQVLAGSGKQHPDDAEECFRRIELLALDAIQALERDQGNKEQKS